MDLVAISLFVVLELAILLGIAMFLIGRKNRKLQARLNALALEKAQSTETNFESIESGYLPYLEKQLLETRAQLDSGGDEAEPEQPLLDALNYRLLLLEAEKKVTERCNDYPENRWQHVGELFVLPEPEDTEASVETSTENKESGDELANARKRIKSLEKFRDNFFGMKKQLQALEDSKQKLVDQLEALLPEAERSDELEALLATLNGQHERLRDEMAQLEAQSDELANGVSNNDSGGDNEPQRIDELNNVLGQQGGVIESLKQVVQQVKDDPTAEFIAELESQFKELERRYQEASDCLQIMTEENERLQDKVDRKDQRIERIEEENNESVANLAEQVDKQKRKMSELHGLVGDLQLEAEKAEELQAKLEQFDLASRDMNMCIQVLEEENELLHSQVAALKHVEEELEKMQQPGSDAATDESAAENMQALQSKIAEKDEQIAALEQAQQDQGEAEALQRQVDSLKAELAETGKRLQEAETRYAEMEQEYLTLYEEANS